MSQLHSLPSPTSSAARAPIRAGLVNAPTLVSAGLRALLEPYGQRLRLSETGSTDPSSYDVLLVGPSADAIPESWLPGLRHTVLLGLGWECRSRPVDPAVRAVACGNLPLNTSALRLVRTLERVLHDPKGPRAVEHRPDPVPVDAALEMLSSRERDVLELICRGLSNQEIAERLYLSVNSVKTYIRTSYRKIGAVRRSQAVLWGLEHGL